MGQIKKILITVKTYPLPSEAYLELVCTAGVLEDGSFIRLYPIDYRYKPYWEWYKKYQWIEVEVEKNEKDPRLESYRPLAGAKIRVLSEPLPTKSNWAERKKYVLAKGVQTMCDLEVSSKTACSIGIIRPKEVTDLIVEEIERDWKAKWKGLFKQQRLFGPEQKPLEKIPYKFSYVFTCEHPDCKGHQKMIEDWEVGALYRRMRDKYRSEDTAVEKVKDKFFKQYCGPQYDTHFFVGTVRRYGSWIIIGTFCPKKSPDERQFEFEL